MKKLFTFMLCMCLLISCIPNAIAVGEPIEEAEPDTEAYRMEEVLELRTENSETYKMSDGTYQCEVYAENKYYPDEKGEYCLIDNTIIPQEHSSGTATYQYANAASDAKVYFSNKVPAVLISYHGNKIAYQMVDAEISQMKVGEKCNSYEFPEYELQSGNCITYYDVKQSTDLIYSVFNGGVKEYLMLKDQNAPAEFRFLFDTGDYIIETDEIGRPVVCDNSGEMLFEFGSLYAIDSAGNGTEAVFYEITKGEDNVTTIEIKIDETYLNDPGRVYPILVDPSVEVSGYSNTFDACVCSLYPNTNYGSNSFLRTGKDPDYGVRRTFIEFAIPSSLAGKTVSSATLSFFWAGGDSSSIKLYSITNSWRSANVTWNTQPTCSSSSAATLSGSTNSWYSASVKNLVQTWLNNDSNNHGVKLQDTTESNSNYWATFHSSESSSANKPKLTITYTDGTSTPTPTYTISYNGNGNTGGSIPASHIAAGGSSITLRTNYGNLTKGDYNFYGWCTNASGTGTTYSAGQTITMPSNNLTLYAKWVKTYNMYVYYTPGITSAEITRMNNAVNTAVSKYLEYGIQIVPMITASNSLLNYRTTSTTCAVLSTPNTPCSASANGCGAQNNCGTLHHRNCTYYLNRATSSQRVLRIVDWKLCNTAGSSDGYTTEVGDLNMVCNVNQDDLYYLVMHELAHTFGLKDGYDGSEPNCQGGCVMNGRPQIKFCDYCKTLLPS